MTDERGAIVKSGYFVLRCFGLVTGLFLMGFGICLVVKSGLGTSPISSAAFILSYVTPLSFGIVTFLFSALFIILQVIIDSGNFNPSILLQLGVTIPFSFFIDFSTQILSVFEINGYFQKLTVLFAGCLVLALGIFVQVKADIVMNPGEALVKVIASKSNLRFGTVKSIFDSILVVIAAALSLIFLHTIYGIREGTIISAVAIGFIIKGIDKIHLLLTGNGNRIVPTDNI